MHCESPKNNRSTDIQRIYGCFVYSSTIHNHSKQPTMSRSTKVMTRSRRVYEVRELSSKVLQMLALDIESFLPEFSRSFASLTPETRCASEHLPWNSATCFASTSVFQVPQHFISAKGIVVLLTSAVPYHIILGPHEHVKLLTPNINVLPVIASITALMRPDALRLELGSVTCYAQALIDIQTPWVLHVPSDSTSFVRPVQPDTDSDTDSDTDDEPPSALHSILLSPHLKDIHFIGSYFAVSNEPSALCCAVQRFGIGVLHTVTTPYRESGFYQLPELETHQLHAFLPISCDGTLKMYRTPICVLYNMPRMDSLHTCILVHPDLTHLYDQVLERFLIQCPILLSWTIRTNFTMYYPVCDFIQQLLTRHGLGGLTVYVVSQHLISVYTTHDPY